MEKPDTGLFPRIDLMSLHIYEKEFTFWIQSAKFGSILLKIRLMAESLSFIEPVAFRNRADSMIPMKND